MNFFYILFSVLMATAPYVSSSERWDAECDQQIEACLSSDTFQNVSLSYPYDHQDWELRVVFNPLYEKIELSNGQTSSFQFYYGVFSRASIPEGLEKHVKNLIKNQLGGLSGGFWGFGSMLNGVLSIDYFSNALAIPGTGRGQPLVSNDISKAAVQISKEESALDKEIKELFKSQTFQKLSLSYSWEGQSYPVYLVYNPLREALQASELEKPVRWPFVMTIDASSYPLSLAEHLKSLVPAELLNDSESVMDVATWIHYFRENPVALYKDLQPITLLNSIVNPDVDTEIQMLFHSEQLAKKCLSYELEGKFYHLLLIHNPEKLTLRVPIEFDTWKFGHISFTRSWSGKVGIFVDKEAPQALIDHLSQLYELSWWDSYWNLAIHNGDKITVYYNKGSWDYTYHPCTWYQCMLKAKP